MPPAPPQRPKVNFLADWLELYSLEQRDGTATRGDLESLLTIPLDTNEADDKSEILDNIASDTFAELDRRKFRAGAGYPFDVVNRHSLRRREDWSEKIPYIFCLHLSYMRHDQMLPQIIDAWKLFERTGGIAARDFIQGELHVFGTSRESGGGFAASVGDLCAAVGEGGGFKGQPTLNKQDDGVDIVVWKGFGDKRSGQIMMYGQCAGGWDWKSKLYRLQPDEFCEQWMVDKPPSPLIKSFYVPHTVADESRWNNAVRSGGILFDRCRIAATIDIHVEDVELWGLCQLWCEVTNPKVDWGAATLSRVAP